jgi:hypothetical protein
MSKSTKYVVACYNVVGGGDVLGVSPVMNSEAEVRQWLREHPGYRSPRFPDGKMQVVTHGSGELRWQILKTDYDDRAAECCKAVKEVLMDATRTPEKRCAAALKLVEDAEEQWMPLKAWAVDIVFSPATCVHNVMARSAVEAERKVSDMLDSGGFGLSEERKAAMLDTLLENVESVKAAGEEGVDA